MKHTSPIYILIVFAVALAISSIISLIVYPAISPDQAHAQGGYTVRFTSYNPARGQTDDDPCTGASGVDQCGLARDGARIIALSRELVGRASWKPFHYGDTVRLTSEDGDERCNGEFIVLDTMAARYRRRGDIFFLNRDDNTSCTATVEKVQ